VRTGYRSPEEIVRRGHVPNGHTIWNPRTAGNDSGNGPCHWSAIGTLQFPDDPANDTGERPNGGSNHWIEAVRSPRDGWPSSDERSSKQQNLRTAW
jgi:hypothetical protein